jgi:hypothetical protein
VVVKFDVLFSPGLGEHRGRAEIALPPTGTTNPIPAAHSVVAKPGTVLDLVVTASPIHRVSLTVDPTLRKDGAAEG